MKIRLDAGSKDPRENPFVEVSRADFQKYAPTLEAYFGIAEQCIDAVGQAIGADIELAQAAEAIGVTVTPTRADNSKLLRLWNNNPVARSFIKTMIAVQPKIAKLMEGAQ
jgi:hypothetical protein